MSTQEIEEELSALLTVHILGNADRPLSVEEIAQRIDDMSPAEREQIVRYYFRET